MECRGSAWKLTAAEGVLPHGSRGTNCKLTDPESEMKEFGFESSLSRCEI